MYAELLRNRSFEDRDPLFAWSEAKRGAAAGSVTVGSENPVHPNNPHFIQLRAQPAPAGETRAGFGLSNAGFDGIPVLGGERYFFAVHARRGAAPASPIEEPQLRVQLEDAAGRVLAAGDVPGIGKQWQRHEIVLTPQSTEVSARLVVLAPAGASVDLDMVSLFPERTFRNRRNGLRADLVQMLADLKPGFLRFPGGCIVEGRDFANMYRWKDTIGEIWERKENENLWSSPAGPSSHYNQSYGLGFFEYFQLCEDIGTVPVPIVNCGMTCQGRNGPAVPLDHIEPFVQDALDLIEFANGPVTSKWGAKRAAMGHPEPFNLTMLGIGNEQLEQVYFDRYQIFYRAIKAKYPAIELIATTGTAPDDRFWKFAWDTFKSGTPADIVDEHYYKSPTWFLAHTDRYDTYDRKGPKVFVGEFAAHDNRRNNLRAALAEAACMTGLWRNADVVVMSAYAPLFARVGHTQWEPNLIWFDATRAYGTPSYHAQAMFAQNRPDVVLPVTIDARAAAPEPPPKARITLGTSFSQAEFKDLKLERDGKVVHSSEFTAGTPGWEMSAGKWVVKGGVLGQIDADNRDLRATVEIPRIHEYTLSLKARRLGGLDGFLILFDLGGEEPGRWNIGAFSNTTHSLTIPGADRVRVKGTLETGKWYDVRIEVGASMVMCYLDGQLMQQSARKPLAPPPQIPGLFATAGRDVSTRELVVQIVNPSSTAVHATLAFEGVSLGAEARATVLSGDPRDENSLESPNRVAPRKEAIAVGGPELKRTFVPHSATTLRIPVR